jgi:hypothetical protein
MKNEQLNGEIPINKLLMKNEQLNGEIPINNTQELNKQLQRSFLRID